MPAQRCRAHFGLSPFFRKGRCDSEVSNRHFNKPFGARVESVQGAHRGSEDAVVIVDTEEGDENSDDKPVFCSLRTTGGSYAGSIQLSAMSLRN